MSSFELQLGERAPEICAGEWFNSKPLKIFDLAWEGKLVLVDFWSASSANWAQTLPHLKAWWNQYHDKGLVIIGVHSPEFEMETGQLQQAINNFGITWPVISDNEFETWNAYQNHYWPRKYLISPVTGIIIHDQIGEGNYQAIEQLIRHELTKLGAADLGESFSTDHRHRLGNICYPKSADTYLGLERGYYKNFDWQQVGTSGEFKDNANNDLAGVSLHGEWTIQNEFLSHSRKTNSMTDYLSLYFSGTEVNLVGQSTLEEATKVLLELDGKPIPQDQQGADVVQEGSKTFLQINEPRVYQAIKATRQNSGSNLRLYTDSEHFRAYTFSFGGCVNKLESSGLNQKLGEVLTSANLTLSA